MGSLEPELVQSVVGPPVPAMRLLERMPDDISIVASYVSHEWPAPRLAALTPQQHCLLGWTTRQVGPRGSCEVFGQRAGQLPRSQPYVRPGDPRMALGFGIRQLDVAHQVGQVAAIDFDANGSEPSQRRRVPYECHAIQSTATVAPPLVDQTGSGSLLPEWSDSELEDLVGVRTA